MRVGASITAALLGVFGLALVLLEPFGPLHDSTATRILIQSCGWLLSAIYLRLCAPTAKV